MMAEVGWVMGAKAGRLELHPGASGAEVRQEMVAAAVTVEDQLGDLEKAAAATAEAKVVSKQDQ